jgi:hypothetical protein
MDCEKNGDIEVIKAQLEKIEADIQKIMELIERFAPLLDRLEERMKGKIKFRL